MAKNGVRVTIDKELESLNPPLTEEERSALESSILVEGCRVPLDVWQRNGDQIILDGHNRYSICQKHGIAFGVNVVQLPDHPELTQDESARLWILTNQAARRNLNQAQVLENAFLREPFLLRIGRAKYERTVGRPSKTKSLSTVDNDSDPKHDTRAEVAKMANVSTGTVAKAQLVRSERPDLWEKAKAGKITANAAYKQHQGEKRAEARAAKADAVKALPEGDRLRLFVADIHDAKVSRQFEYIITDPPYPRKYLPLYGVLAKRSLEWLAPGGLVVAMAGQSYLDEAYALMAEHLEYYWTACYLTPGQPTPLRMVNVNTSWKPLLIFKRPGDTYKGPIFGDVFRSDRNEKDHHDWGQSESGMYDIVSHICLAGSTILDPFLGGGATAVAAVQHGCCFEGFDLNEEHVKVTAARLEDKQ